MQHQALPISDAELDAMLARCTAATPGPWKSYIEGRDHESGSDFIMTGPGGSGEDIELTGATRADQDFIANARQDVPRLIAEIRRLRGRTGQSGMG
jgi:hypothetical protein